VKLTLNSFETCLFPEKKIRLKMTVFDMNSMLSSVTWSDEQLYLKEYIL
jgi:hypothetical protein